MPRPKKQCREPFWRTSRNCWFVHHGSRTVRLSPDREEAWRLWHELMAKPPEKRHIPSGPDAQVVVIFDAFLDWCLKHKAGRTYDWYHDYLQSFARTLASGLTVSQIKPFHVQEWIDANPTWKTGKRGAVIAVQRAFNWAVRMGLIDVSPVRTLEKPKGGRREHVISEEEFEVILSLVRDEEFRDLLKVCWETACRPQEAVSVGERRGGMLGVSDKGRQGQEAPADCLPHRQGAGDHQAPDGGAALRPALSEHRRPALVGVRPELPVRSPPAGTRPQEGGRAWPDAAKAQAPDQAPARR
jgi:hypothetical protein